MTQQSEEEIVQMREQLVLQHQDTAKIIANQIYRTATHALEKDELEAIALLGLVQAANSWHAYCERNDYDSNAVQYFYAYARRRIHGAIIDHLRTEDRTVNRVTRSLRARSKRLREAGEDQGASVTELAKRSGLTEGEVNATLRDMGNRPVSIEGDQIDKAHNTSVESDIVTNYLLDELVKAIQELDLISQAVVCLHYVYGQELQQVARIIGITNSRASTLHTDSVIILRDKLMQAAQETNINLFDGVNFG